MIKHIIWILLWVMVGASLSKTIHTYISFLPEM